MKYFAYGSNMNSKQMQERCPGSKPLIPATLKDYRLTERKKADIDPEPGSVVYGEMYEITEEHITNLDNKEGYPTCYTKKEVEIETAEGETYQAFTYIMTPEKKAHRDGIPYKDDYRECCSKGAQECGVPNEFDCVTIIAYGTLMTGECNHHLVRKALYIKSCTIKGTLYDTGLGFPAFSKEGQTNVQAELIQIPRSAWSRLDREGFDCEFIAATLPDGSTAGGYAYFMKELPPTSKVIETGSWKKPFPFTELSCDFLNTKDSFYIRCSFVEGIVSYKFGEESEKYFKLGLYWGPEFISALYDCHFELWETENSSDDKASPKWIVKLYNGKEIIKTVNGYGSAPSNWNDLKKALSILWQALDLNR